MDVVIPFKPREYQLPMLNHILQGGKRAFVEWHRRAGKDLCMWNLTVRMASTNIGLYFYFLPTYTQGKKIIWDGITNDGISFLSFIPKEMIARDTNGTEMKIKLKNGSIVQIIGTDNYDAIRGTNPIGCVFSEFAYQNPMAWDVVRPILRINKGWALFNTTPNGENHSHDIGEMAKKHKGWFHEVLTIKDTGQLTEADMDEERAEGYDEDMIQQEYYCSHKVGNRGSYYSSLVLEAETDNRITDLPVEKHIPVDIFQDIGRNDSYSLGFLQKIGNEIRFVDFYQDNGKDVSHYIEYVLEMKYRIGIVYLPHDAKQKRVEAKNSVWEQWEEAGFRVKLVPKHGINSGIQETRKKFKRFKFDKMRTVHLIRCLKTYHKEWDERAKVFRQVPKHDWSSHAADMVRYVSVGWEDDKVKDTSYKESVGEYIDTSGIINPLTHKIDKSKRINEYTGQAESYVSME